LKHCAADECGAGNPEEPLFLCGDQVIDADKWVTANLRPLPYIEYEGDHPPVRLPRRLPLWGNIEP
jgi:hypothetical protein